MAKAMSDSSLAYICKVLTREANVAHKQWNDPQSDGRGGAYYSGLERGLRRALTMLNKHRHVKSRGAASK
jgi:hypothetical protein